MSKGYEKVFRTMVEEIYSVPALRKRRLTAFWPMRGADYARDHGWLFVGQSVNGWGGRKETAPWFGAYGPPKVGAIRKYDEPDVDPGECPLECVTTYPGQFWDTIQRLVPTHLGGDPVRWHRPIAWSNLYKVAPADPNLRLDETIKCAQLAHCRKLLALEVDELRPSRIIFLTGATWWVDFVDPGIERLVTALEEEKAVVEAKYRGIPCVLAPHPRRANFKGMSIEALCKAIERALP